MSADPNPPIKQGDILITIPRGPKIMADPNAPAPAPTGWWRCNLDGAVFANADYEAHRAEAHQGNAMAVSIAPAPAPTGDQPTWTIDPLVDFIGLALWRADGWLDDDYPDKAMNHVAGARVIVRNLPGVVCAALVEAVHRSQQLDIVEEAHDHLAERCRILKAERDAALAVIEAVRQWGPDAQTPRRVARSLAAYDAALAERRHRD